MWSERESQHRRGKQHWWLLLTQHLPNFGTESGMVSKLRLVSRAQGEKAQQSWAFSWQSLSWCRGLWNASLPLEPTITTTKKKLYRDWTWNLRNDLRIQLELSWNLTWDPHFRLLWIPNETLTFCNSDEICVSQLGLNMWGVQGACPWQAGIKHAYQNWDWGCVSGFVPKDGRCVPVQGACPLHEGTAEH